MRIGCDFSASPRVHMHSLIHITLSPPPERISSGPENRTQGLENPGQDPWGTSVETETKLLPREISAIVEGLWSTLARPQRGLPAEEGIPQHSPGPVPAASSILMGDVTGEGICGGRERIASANT